MKKLFINGRFLSGASTAVNSVALELALALQRIDVPTEVIVVVPRSLLKVAEDVGLEAQSIGSFSGIFWEQFDLPGVRRKGWLLGFFNTVPLLGTGYVTMLHDAHIFRTPESYKFPTRLWRKVLAYRAGGNGNYVLTISNYAKRTLKEERVVVEERVGVVPNGVGPIVSSVADYSILEKLGVIAGEYVLALASNLPHKNTPLLLEAFTQKILHDIPLVLFGSGSKDDYVSSGCEVSENVLFSGRVTDEELAALYSSALGVCVPSTEEGFGLVALEGMAFGVPTIVANSGALPEVVGNAGFVMNSRDPISWAERIHQLRMSPDLQRQYRELSVQRASEFSWDDSANKVVQHLERWSTR